MTQIVKTQTELVPADLALSIIKLEEAKKQITTKLDELKADLLLACQNNDVLTLKTDKYTISRCKRQTVGVYDAQQVASNMFDVGLQAELVQTLSEASTKSLKDYLKKGNKLDGAYMTETEYVMVKIPKE